MCQETFEKQEGEGLYYKQRLIVGYTCTLKHNMKNRKDLKVLIDHRPEVIAMNRQCAYLPRGEAT